MTSDTLDVIKDDQTYPFSRGILARSILPTGLSIDTIYEIVDEVYEQFKEEQEPVPVSYLHDKVAAILDENDLVDEKRRFLLSHKIAQMEKPIVILIGGTSGIGKSTIAAALTRRLGIERVIGTDEVREVMRYMLPEDLVPTLHQSSFDAGDALTGPEFPEDMIVGFSRQASLVNRGVMAYINRLEKEGLKAIFNGVHLVPGMIEMNEESPTLFFHYILTLEDEQEHERRFRYRAEGSYRNAQRYIDKLERVRGIQEYYLDQYEHSNATRIENKQINETVTKIVDDLIEKLQEIEPDE